jgi:putative transposase
MSLKGPALAEAPEWAGLVPYQIKSIAIKEACDAVSRAKIKCKKTGDFNQVKFRSRKSKQSIYIPKSAVIKGGIYKRLLGPIKAAESFDTAKYDCHVVFEYGNWWLCIPEDKTVSTPRTKACSVSLDPGVRTFQTIYSNEMAGSIGEGAFKRIARLCLHLDKMTGKAAVARAKSKRNIRKACDRLRFKIDCLKSELHNKTARFLVDSFDEIVTPEFTAKDFAPRLRRKLKRKTVRAMLNLNHGGFNSILRRKAAEAGTRLTVVSEAYSC